MFNIYHKLNLNYTDKDDVRKEITFYFSVCWDFGGPSDLRSIAFRQIIVVYVMPFSHHYSPPVKIRNF